MVMKITVKGIAFLVLMMSIALIVMADTPDITGISPTSPFSTTEGTPQTFSFNSNQTVNISWQINGTEVHTQTEVTTGNYTNSTPAIGVWNVTAVISNVNGTILNIWEWTVTALTPVETTPQITSSSAVNITDISADILFSVNQSDADTIVRYGLAESSLTNESIWSNNTGLSRTRSLSGLSKNTTYYYSIYAYNGSNQSLFSNSSIQSFTTFDPSAPNFTSGPVTDSPIVSSVNITFNLNQSNALTNIQYGTTPALGFWAGGDNSSSSNRKIFLPGLSQGTTYYYSVFAYNASNQGYFLNSTISNFTTTYPAPQSSSPSPNSPTESTSTETINFTISFTQTVNVTWLINGTPVANASSVTSSYLNPTPSIGTWNITVIGSNINGTASYSWTWTVHPKTFTAGNRVWDGNRPDLFSLKYTWNPMSFSGFYYDINSDVGNESITMTMNSYTDRTVSKGNIVYDTAPEEVAFGYTGFGSYQVIGFMADKYFAGYIANTTPPNPSTTVGVKSALAQGQLHKVLMDDDTKRTISVGGTLALQEGYVLKAVDIDLNARTMLISLLKDGNEIDPGTPLSAGQTYVYAPSKVGSVSDLPIIMVRFDSVFSGTEVQAAFLRGLFQISSSPTSVKTGDTYNDMKVTTVSDKLIEMSNNNDVSLGRGNTENLMGNMNIVVADNDTLRFALSTVQTGTFEVRSTVYRDSDPIDTWNPYNFGMNIGTTSVGFYYDLNSGVGNETLRLLAPLNGSRSISAQNLDYTTTPQDVSFGYSGFGGYQVIGFMADKYFAGYDANTTIPSPTSPVGVKSALAQGQLHKVLIDDDTKRTISVGSTLTLQEGYVLKAVDIDLSARTMLVELLKDGNIVDPGTPLNAGQTYIYAPSKVGSVSDLPLIMVRFDSVFSGTEVQAAFLRGVFQIKSSPTTVKTGDDYNDMTVTTVNDKIIEMNNNNAISLDNGKNEQLMGNINLKVGDTSATDNALRFYFAVDVTPEMVANQLVIDAPAKATAGDVLNIKVTAGGNPQDGVSVAINSVDAGQTDSNGLVNYTLPRTLKGIYNITATKLGFQQATKSIEVLQYVDLRLSIDAPATANQFAPLSIKVTYNGSVISGATIVYDNATVGTTDNNGVLNYTPQTSGTHTISAAKTGYVTAVRDINVRAPFSQYQALNINITPGTVFVNEQALIRSNITNVGTKADTLPVELVSNGTAVDNVSVSLAPGEIKEVNFTRKETQPGNYTIEILGQKGILEVKEQPINYLLIGVIATIIGLVVIYLLTAKGLLGNLIGKFGKKGLGEIKK